ncbi:hypothetical protein DDB_G0291496 [Dictyostelium discoideum AX4]|uniref:RNase III domain-containing protein n=1 Tax=Dictyostelium discoideum TaxID=44689 RepID=Q54EI2_DICDI|nr:hypothetical protein DDB_G0291496 [Dictyostelium discoideum AX4]EAL61732.1 hypothetical protein DDB_G0291496 [Dictyostelium discoideum AX4]|eukprot:XP_635258.1 hypothetical protein DDB_G0291496 [Dictyostelium discoideum AX4]
MTTISFNSSIKQLKDRGIINIFHQPKTHKERFEILEFHGDSTLSYLISTYLLNYKTYYNPHLLTKLRSLASSNQLLCDFFNLFELEDFLSEEELPRDCKNIKPRADIVECLISELSQSKDSEAELLLKGIVGFLISAGEKELDREFPHIIDKGILKKPKPPSSTLNYKSNFYNSNNNSKKSFNDTTTTTKQVYGSGNSSSSANNNNNINIKQPKAIVSYVVDNKSPSSSPLPSPFVTPSSLSGSNISVLKSSGGNNINSIMKRNPFEVNLLKPIDIYSNGSIIMESNIYNYNNNNSSSSSCNKIGKSNSSSTTTTSVLKSKEIFITPNNVNDNYSLDVENDFPLSPFSVELALISNT